MTDCKLLSAARRGDIDAFDVFYRRHNRLLIAYFRRRTRDPELAADLMAEVFSAALLMVTGEDELPREPHAWLYAVARNKLADSRRRGAVEDKARRALGIEPIVLEDQDLLKIDSWAGHYGVLELLADLPIDERNAIRARILDERDYADISTELGCSDLVVRKRVSRGLAAIRSQLEHES